ncbi:hypothetical protein BVG79_01764 [Ketogulonicigenium robustum]|uniref:Uncharacterized protein n=2 Tax=Ketogulonicigenium robustum TaxID=92947 RepID=A0A1W6P0T0_9RHOB|nr:hypothetical protein BVG79_01764 [Ketogulonicigenium robustum]
MVFCGVYPLITLLAYIVAPITGGWPIWARNLLIAPFMVTAMVFVIIPTIQHILSRRR